MAKKYLEVVITPAVAEAQQRYFGRSRCLESGSDRDPQPLGAAGGGDRRHR